MDSPWVGVPGLKIRAVDGLEERGFDDIMSTPFFYPANPGDTLRLIDKAYKFNVATYAPIIENRFIYTYDYAPDQSWTVYRNDLAGPNYRQTDHVFDEKVYFRVCIRKASGEVFGGCEDINDILVFKPGAKEQAIKPWIKDEVSKAAQRTASYANKNTKTFAILTDTHVTVNGTWPDTMESLRQLHEHISFDGVIHLGDMTDGMVTRLATRHYASVVMNDIKALGSPFWMALGNHDSNYFKKNTDVFTIDEQRELYLNGQMPHYCVDLCGLRLIFLDSFDSRDELRYGYSADCIGWLDSALASMGKGSQAIIFSHLPPRARLQYWSKTLRGEKELKDVTAKHIAKILAWINGHNHADGIDTAEGMPIISIGPAKCESFIAHKPKHMLTPERTLDTATQELFDILTVDLENKSLKFARFGAGYDKEISDGKGCFVCH